MGRGLASHWPVGKSWGLAHGNPNEAVYRDGLENAGQYYYFTERSPEMSAALRAFERHHGDSVTQILHTLKFRGDVERLPAGVADIYRSLEARRSTKNG